MRRATARGLSWYMWYMTAVSWDSINVLLVSLFRRKASGDAKDSARTRALCVMAALAVRSGRDAPPVFAEVARAVQASQVRLEPIALPMTVTVASSNRL